MCDVNSGRVSLVILSVVMVTSSLFFYYCEFGGGPFIFRPGFGSWQSSQREKETMPMRGRTRIGLDTTRHGLARTTLKKKQKFQQEQVAKFCNKYGHDKLELKLPTSQSGSTKEYFKHMLVDAESETIYCFVPKAGCTTLKIMFFEALGVLPASQVGAKHVNQDLLLKLVGRTSFRAMSASRRLNSLQKYFKFVMYRNPLERLLSGYRNKIEQYPLVRWKATQQFDWLRKAIFNEYHPMEYKKWLLSNNESVNIAFVDFIDYWLKGSSRLQQSAHFRPISELCQPCRSRFDFYGNFKNFEQDAKVLIDRLHSKSEKLRKGRYTSEANSPSNTSELLTRYYGQLSMQKRRAVFHKLSVELDFYYHVFPEEWGIHKNILGINDYIPHP